MPVRPAEASIAGETPCCSYTPHSKVHSMSARAMPVLHTVHAARSLWRRCVSASRRSTSPTALAARSALTSSRRSGARIGEWCMSCWPTTLSARHWDMPVPVPVSACAAAACRLNLCGRTHVCMQGWDKTYCLQFLEEFETVHFFGDKTYPVRGPAAPSRPPALLRLRRRLPAGSHAAQPSPCCAPAAA